MSITVFRAKRSPMVTIADADFDRLDALATADAFADNLAADFLAAELDRALVRPVDEIGPDTVRMNSRVAFRIGDRHNIEIRTLVYPDEYARQPDRDDLLSVMTPLGAALIGLRVGTGMSYETAIATTQQVTVVAVLDQLDAAQGDTGVLDFGE